MGSGSRAKNPRIVPKLGIGLQFIVSYIAELHHRDLTYLFWSQYHLPDVI